MIRKKEVCRFQTKDDGGNVHIIIEYRTSQQSNEIRSDRMSPAPTIGQLFEALDGRAVEQIDDNSFQILGANKLVRKV